MSKLSRFNQFYSEAKMSATPKGFKDIKVDIISPKGEPIVVYSGTNREIHWRAGGFDSAALAQKLLSYHKSGIDVYPLETPANRSTKRPTGYILHIIRVNV